MQVMKHEIMQQPWYYRREWKSNFVITNKPWRSKTLHM